MVCKALLWADDFWISYIKWSKLCNNNLSVVLGSKQEGMLELVTILTFLFTLLRCQVVFQWKQTNEKLRNA